MDRSIRWGISSLQRWLSRRVQTVSKNSYSKFGSFSQAIQRSRKKLLAALSCFAAILLGLWADDMSRSEAISSWERAHLPPVPIFQFSMESLGARQVQNISEVQRLSRSLPVNLDSAGSVWISSNSQCVAYFSNPDDAIQAHFYCLKHSSFDSSALLSQPWRGAGIGWKGMENAIEAVKTRSAEALREPQPRKKSVYRDGREIVY